MFCKFFIERPVLSIVISIVILLAGVLSIWASPVEQYPNIVPPSIQVSATFPGATSDILAATVASPLENQISGISNMIYMVSTSANGSNTVTITVYFDIGTNLDDRLGDMLNRVNAALPQLPNAVKNQGVTVLKSSPNMFMVVSMFSPSGNPDNIYVSNYAYRYVYPVLSQINGVGVVSLAGNRNFAMRVWLDPNKMASYGLSTLDVVSAIQEQNQQYAIGQVSMPPTDGNSQFQFMITTKGYLKTSEEFGNIIIRANNNSNQIIRLKNIGHVTLAGQQYITNLISQTKDTTGKIKTQEQVALLLYLTPGANQLMVKEKVLNAMKNLEKYFPAGIKYEVPYDSSLFVNASIHKVLETFRDAFILVFLVVFLFIQNIRGTIIPILAIPISIIGTFAITYLMGFSINTLTLFGVILAIGIVVDDAIVVLENVERIMEEQQLDAKNATIKAMEEVASPVIAIVLVLNAVFLPVAFLGGFSGLLYKQFAVTIAISVFLSGVVALTLTPTLCTLLLKNKNHNKPKHNFFKIFDYGFNTLKNQYIKGVKWLIKRSVAAFVMFGVVIIGTIYLFFVIPTSLVPMEDLGNFFGAVKLPSATAMDRTTKEASKFASYILKSSVVTQVISVVGLDILDNGAIKSNAALSIAILKPWEERKAKNETSDALIQNANIFGFLNKSSQNLAFNQPPINGMSTTGGVTFYLQSTTDTTPEKLYQDSIILTTELMKSPAISYAVQLYDVNVPQVYIDVDRDKAKLLGLNIADIYSTLQSIFGTYYVNYFEKWNNLWWVILQSDYKYRNNPRLLNTVYIKNYNNKMVPLGSVAKFNFQNGPEVVTRFNTYLASQIIANPKPGYTSGDVMTTINDTTTKVLGTKYAIKWFGPAYQQAIAGQSSIIAFSLGIIMIFLILAALYEMWSLPFAVLMAIPFALMGAIMMLFITSRPNDIFFQVSLITLIGLSAKNAILIVEFALDGVRKDGKSTIDAAIHAAELRFRPIVMTSLAFILGALPLALSSGAGANSQHSVGTGIIGGMLGSTFIATFFVPVFFVIVMNFSKRKLIHEKSSN